MHVFLLYEFAVDVESDNFSFWTFAPPTYLILLYNLVALMSHPTLSNSFHPCLRVPLNRILHPSTFFCSYIRLLKLITKTHLPLQI
jgi:hypothetical protein